MKKFVLIATVAACAASVSVVAAPATATESFRIAEPKSVQGKNHNRGCRRAPTLGWAWAKSTAHYGLERNVRGWKYAVVKRVEKVRRMNRIRVRVRYESERPYHFGYVTIWRKRCADGYTWYRVKRIY